MASPRKFVIGNASYEVTPHPPSEMGLFALKLATLATGPVATLVKAQKDLRALKEGIGELDLSNLNPTDVQTSLYKVVEHVTANELQNIFAYTKRDGQSLENEVVYDMAYRGNWTEWYKALYKILEMNGFFDFLSSLRNDQEDEGGKTQK